MARGCDYEAQLAASCRLVGDALEHQRWRLVYQSNNASYGREPWLGPDIRDALREAEAEGVKAVVVAPIGFVCDHMEVIMDLDVDAAAVARELGLTMARAGDRRHASRVRRDGARAHRRAADAGRAAAGARLARPEPRPLRAGLLPAGPARAAEARALRRRRPLARADLSALARTDFDVIVIGAGLAGLHAALTLEAVGPSRARARGAAARRRAHSFDAPARRHGRSRRHVHRRRLCARDRRGRAPRRRAHRRDADARVLPRAGSRARRRDHSAARVADASRERFPGSKTESSCPGTTIACSRCATTRSRAPATGSTRGTRRSTCRRTTGSASLGLSERAIALAYGLNVSFGRDAHDVSALLLLFRGAFSKRSARSPRRPRASASRRATACSGYPKRWPARSRGGVELGRAASAIELADDGAVVTLRGRAPLPRAARRSRPCRCRVLRRIAIEPQAAGLPGRRGRDVAVAAADAGLSRAAQPLLGAGRLCREPVHGHARRHARRRAQSRRPDARSRA